MDNNLPDIRPNQLKWQYDQTAYWLNRLKNTVYRDVKNLKGEASSGTVEIKNILSRLSNLENQMILLEHKVDQCCGESGLSIDWLDELYPIGVIVQLDSSKNPISLFGGAWQDVTPTTVTTWKVWKRVG